MRMVEAMESKGCRLPLVKGEAELADKLAAITRQVHVLCPFSFGRNILCPQPPGIIPFSLLGLQLGDVTYVCMIPNAAERIRSRTFEEGSELADYISSSSKWHRGNWFYISPRINQNT